MFVLGFHFPASMGNKVALDKVVEKLDSEVKMDGVSKIKINYGKKFDNELEYSKLDTLLAKALIHYAKKDGDSNNKYLIYTNKYQMSELSKQFDKDEETQSICKLFDGMEPVRVSLI